MFSLLKFLEGDLQSAIISLLKQLRLADNATDSNESLFPIAVIHAVNFDFLALAGTVDETVLAHADGSMKTSRALCHFEDENVTFAGSAFGDAFAGFGLLRCDAGNLISVFAIDPIEQTRTVKAFAGRSSTAAVGFSKLRVGCFDNSTGVWVHGIIVLSLEKSAGTEVETEKAKQTDFANEAIAISSNIARHSNLTCLANRGILPQSPAFGICVLPLVGKQAIRQKNQAKAEHARALRGF